MLTRMDPGPFSRAEAGPFSRAAKDVQIAFTFGELDQAILGFENIAKNCMLILTGAHYDSFAPVLQFDPVAVFRVPLIEPTPQAGQEADGTGPTSEQTP